MRLNYVLYQYFSQINTLTVSMNLKKGKKKISTNIKGNIALNFAVGVVVKDIAIGTEGLGFDYWADQIGHTAANGSPPLRCFTGALLSRR